MKPKTIYVVLGLLAAGALYATGRHAAALSAELANWKRAAQHALQARSAYVRTIDSLQGLERAHRARFQALQGDLGRLGRQADRLAKHADSLDQASASVDSLLPAYRRALLGSQAAYDVCRATIAVSDSGWDTCRQRASLAEQRAERLDSLLRAGLRVRECRLLLFPCPSRGLAFLGGAIGGYLLSRR